MAREELLKILQDCDTFKKGHFVYSHGHHGSDYVDKDAFSKYPGALWFIGCLIADHFHYNTRGIDVVIGPIMGGVKLADHVAGRLPGKVLALYAEKEMRTQNTAIIEESGHNIIVQCFIPTGRRILKRGFDEDVRGKRVLVVEDTLSTGASARETVEAVKRAQGEVVAVAAVCNRGNAQSQYVGGVPIFTLLNLEMPTYPEDSCPLCKEGVPINTDFGHGKEFLEKRGGSE